MARSKLNPKQASGFSFLVHSLASLKTFLSAFSPFYTHGNVAGGEGRACSPTKQRLSELLPDQASGSGLSHPHSDIFPQTFSLEFFVLMEMWDNGEVEYAA